MAIEIQLHGFIVQANGDQVMCEARHPKATLWSVWVAKRKGDNVAVLFDSDYATEEDAFAALEQQCSLYPKADVEIH